MTGPDHYRRAEMLAAEAYRHVGMEDEQEAAAAWSAVAQIHATLALAAATALAAVIPLNRRESYPAEVRAWRDAAGTPDGPPRS
jgi:type IV secretory pathway component VirB8